MIDAGYRSAVVVVALALMAAVVKLSFCHAVSLPPKPPRPPPKRVAVAAVSAQVESDPDVYAQHLVADSHQFRVKPPATPAAMSHVLPYQIDTRRRTLQPGHKGKHATAEVLGLKLSLSVGDIEGTPRRQMILTIANTTDQYLAYRVRTRPSRGTQPCHDKSDLAHNAVALAPHETIRRAECTYRSGWRLFVDQVETIALPPLSYYYVSAVPPPELGLDLLTSRAHRPATSRGLCHVFHSADLDEALRSGATTWRDLVDFYARHTCENYAFPNNYKAFQKDGERPLPAVTRGR